MGLIKTLILLKVLAGLFLLCWDAKRSFFCSWLTTFSLEDERRMRLCSERDRSTDTILKEARDRERQSGAGAQNQVKAEVFTSLH